MLAMHQAHANELNIINQQIMLTVKSPNCYFIPTIDTIHAPNTTPALKISSPQIMLIANTPFYQPLRQRH